jgi:hypothetical protein
MVVAAIFAPHRLHGSGGVLFRVFALQALNALLGTIIDPLRKNALIRTIIDPSGKNAAQESLVETSED